MQWWWLIFAVWFGTGLLVPILWLLSMVWQARLETTQDNVQATRAPSNGPETLNHAG
jgi:hypothetical protein